MKKSAIFASRCEICSERTVRQFQSYFVDFQNESDYDSDECDSDETADGNESAVYIALASLKINIQLMHKIGESKHPKKRHWIL